ncbi:MAG: hypothetical protein NTY80_01640 [candidate division SR1 bacterium]|nr:hypothetical protein [candidate division SR1 bacterium]
MKKIIRITVIASIFGIFVIAAVNSTSCTTKTVSKVEILKKTGQEILKQEAAMLQDTVRGSEYDCAKLAKAATDEVMFTLFCELKPEQNSLYEGDIPKVVIKYSEYWRDKYHAKKRKIWEKLKVVVNPQVSRVCPAYSQKLLTSLNQCCEKTVKGNGLGYKAINLQEEKVKNIFVSYSAIARQYRDQLYAHFFSLAKSKKVLG